MFALGREAGAFRRRAWDGVEVVVTGVGRANAGRGIRDALARRAPQLVVSAGFAGALAAQLDIGDVLVEADADFPLADALVAAGARRGRFHCAPRVAVTAAEKAALRRETGADAVEMESAEIRAACRGRGIPSATVRVISDDAHDDLPLDFNALMTPEWTLHPGRVAAALLRSPGAFLPLLRGRRRSNAAAARLAAVLAQGLGP